MFSDDKSYSWVVQVIEEVMSRTRCASTDMSRGTKSGNIKYRDNTKFPAGVYAIHTPDACEQVFGDKTIHLRRNSAFERKETSKIKSRSGTRKCPSVGQDPKTYPIIMTKKEYERLLECSRIVTAEEKEAALAAAARENERSMKECMERKEAFRRIDVEKSREKKTKLSEVQEEARSRTMHVLERAENMKLEEEEEMQICNRLILATKCRAIRDAQVAEKKLIEKELADEEKRLNDMMENERRLAIKEDLRKEQEEAAKKQAFANILKEQIEENEEQRFMEFERKQEESRLINLNNNAWQQEELEKARKKEAENARIRRELAEGNEQLKHFKAMEEEENRIIDQRIQEYQRLKNERAARLAEERRLENLKREQERTRLVARAVQDQDLQARIDEINAARIQEEVEREWRRREKEEALKRAEAQRALMTEREEQIKSKRLIQAIELEREKRESEEIVRLQKESVCREKKEIEQKQQVALKHRAEILKQVNERERERIQTRQRIFEEGLAIRMETEMRKKKLREAIERKCQEMKDNKVPEMYINEVKRMIDNV
ncbi:hypothetical protein KM043_015186 [Ampulex compressa]|nr:hypothetical protein KM043_015186 [Ampulex compressa]